MQRSACLVPGVLAALLFCPPVVQSCTDEDATLQQLTLQQSGAALTCSQLLLEGAANNPLQLCDDPTFHQQLCCASCAQVRTSHLEQHQQLLQSLAGRMERARSLLSSGNERFRSAPLHDRGSGMPLVALGTGGVLGWEGTHVIESALRMGYRHFDSAIMYDNHGAVQQGLEQSGVARGEVFITSKVPPDMMGFRRATEALERIRSELPGSYADLCLVHWPHSSESSRPAEWAIVERAGTWRAMEEAFRSGICRAIGVSNYMVKHLEELERYAEVLPSVNQVEYSPLAPMEELLQACRQRGIVIEAFGWHRPEVLEHDAVQQVAREIGRPASQVVTLWFLQQGWVPLYRSRKVERLAEHAEALDESPASLSQAQLEMLRGQAQAAYPWRYYTGKWEPPPWNTLVMGETGHGNTCAQS